jgi:hypothetical protein
MIQPLKVVELESPVMLVVILVEAEPEPEEDPE